MRVPEELHRKLKVTAVGNNESLGGFVVRLLGGCMGSPQQWKPAGTNLSKEEAKKNLARIMTADDFGQFEG